MCLCVYMFVFEVGKVMVLVFGVFKKSNIVSLVDLNFVIIGISF